MLCFNISCTHEHGQMYSITFRTDIKSKNIEKEIKESITFIIKSQHVHGQADTQHVHGQTDTSPLSVV